MQMVPGLFSFMYKKYIHSTDIAMTHLSLYGELIVNILKLLKEMILEY